MRVQVAILAVMAFVGTPLAAGATPEPPRAMNVVAVGDLTAVISWSPVFGADSYLVYRGPDPANMTQIDETESNFYRDEHAVPKWIYGVVVVDNGERSPIVIASSSNGQSGGDCISANSDLHVAVTVANCVRD